MFRRLFVCKKNGERKELKEMEEHKAMNQSVCLIQLFSYFEV